MDRYIKIPVDIITNTNLSNGAKILYGYIISLSKKEGYSYANNDYLKNELNVSKRTITNLIKELKNEKVIEATNEHGKRKLYISSRVL